MYNKHYCDKYQKELPRNVKDISSTIVQSLLYLLNINIMI
jgi:hypothetical protein